MTQDDSSRPELHPWKKAIPEGRDRLQSKILVWIGALVLCYLTFTTLQFAFIQGGIPYRTHTWTVLAISLFFALIAWRLKSATPFAAISGGMVCLLVTMLAPGRAGSSIFHSGLSPLILLFILTRESTRLGREKKAEAGLAERRRGRSAAQIIANLGIAGIFGSMLGMGITDLAWGGHTWAGDNGAEFMALFQMPLLAALAEATADTVSSEIGQAFGGRPFLLTNLRRVPPGTDGAVSLGGTLAGVISALIIATTGAPALGMNLKECSVVFAAAVFGLFFDSLLGATIERKGWLGNDLVNLLSTTSAAAASLLAIRILQERLFL